MIRASALDEECERELEREEEQEEEEEIQVPKKDPRSEIDWGLDKCLEAMEFNLGDHILNLPKAVKKHLLPVNLSTICWDGHSDWGTSTVLLTTNFFKTLASSSQLSMYLRRVDTFIIAASGNVLLISNREAEELLEWEFEQSYDFSRLMHSSYACREHASLMDQRSHPRLPISEGILSRLQLFNGETQYCTEDRRKAVQSILSSPASRAAALLLPGLRGLDRFVPASHLFEICKEM
jgi:hypothetical protein